MRRFVTDKCCVSSEEVAKNELAKNFNLGWVQNFWDEFPQNVYGW